MSGRRLILAPLLGSFLLPLAVRAGSSAPATAAASASVSAAPGDAAAGEAIELGDYMGRKRSIEVVVGGQRGTFLLDTGGGVTIVTPEFAKRTGCTPWGQISGFRLTGERLDMPRCENMEIGLPGGRTMAPVTAGVIDLMSLLAKGDAPVDGSLALDALDGQLFTLDVRAGTLQFETPESLEARVADAVEIPIRVSRYGNSARGVAVYARSKTAKGDLWLELDSGGDAPVLLPNSMAAEAGADPAVEKQPYTLTLSGTDRDVTQPTRAIVRDMVRDGVVGMPVLVHWRLTFDLVRDRLWVAPAAR
ncbi:MAG: aspartyl protease family protein [Pseudoxanthomonas sp.]